MTSVKNMNGSQMIRKTVFGYGYQNEPAALGLQWSEQTTRTGISINWNKRVN